MQVTRKAGYNSGVVPPGCTPPLRIVLLEKGDKFYCREEWSQEATLWHSIHHVGADVGAPARGWAEPGSGPAVEWA